MEKIKRYISGVSNYDTPMMYEHPKGDWIKYEDFEKVVTKLMYSLQFNSGRMLKGCIRGVLDELI